MIGCDAGPPGDPRLAQVAGRLSQAGVEVHLDASGEALAARAGTLVKSPGVPQHAPAVLAARARGVPVLGELELAWRLLANEFVAVTGTNGKTTTTEWIGHVHRVAAVPVAVAGNVGTAVSTLVGALDAASTVVCEASSFQLEDSSAFAPEAAVLLNLSPDHLDRHPSYENYVAAKLRIFANQGNDDVAVAPDDLGLEDLGGCARRVLFGGAPEAELSARAGYLWWDRAAADRGAVSCRFPASTTRRTRWPPPPCAWRAGSTSGRSPRACGRSPASPTGSSQSASTAASRSSTTPRRPTSPARSSRCARSRAACT